MDTTVQKPINASQLAPQQSLVIPQTPVDTTDYSSLITPVTNQIAGDLTSLTAQTNQQQQATNRNAQEQLDLMGLLTGRTADTQQANEQAGVNAETANLNRYVEQLTKLNADASALNREAQAIPLQVQQESQGLGRTDAGIAPMTTSRLRDNALRALSIGQQADIAAAAATGSQLRLNAAKEKAQQIVDLKYKPLEAQLEIKARQYELNKDILSQVDKKRAEALGIAIEKEKTALAEKKETEKAISDIGVTLARYGVDSKIVKDVLSSRNINEAIQKAGANLQDPKAKMELESIRLDQINKKIQAQKSSYELSLLQKYGGMSPAEYRKELKAEQEAIATAKTEQEKARLQGLALDKKITLLDSVLQSDAIDSVVGSSFASRAATGVGGFLGRFAAGAAAGAVAGLPFAGVGAVPGAVVGGLIGGTSLALQGSKDYFSGSADRLVGQTEQFISKEFIENLISAKAAGATFGALTKPEQDALTAAASFIGQRKIYSGTGEEKQVVGYDMSEADFKRELTTIKQLAEKAYEKSTGQTYSSDEKLLLDQVFNETSTTSYSTPQSYY